MNLLHVDMTTGLVTEGPPPKRYESFGGRGLTSAMISNLVPPDCDPFGAENLLIFAPGFLGGTPFANSGRLSVGAKSPLTGGIKESNVGGTMAKAISNHGIDAVVVRGKAPEGTLYHLVIDENGKGTLIDAGDCRGMRNYELAELLLSKLGENNAISSIGPAGEMMLTSASIQTTDTDGHPSRAAGRGGLGAVMGAKGLKALVVSKSGRQSKDIKQVDDFNDASKRFASAVVKDGWSGQVLPQFGTASILANTNAAGALPTRNARQGSFEGADKIDGNILAETIRERGGKTAHKGCSQCVIKCSNIYVDEAGKPITSALEYETLWAMGAMICNDDLDSIARLDFLCDDIGLDTMNTGTAIAVAMDSGHISFGDSKGAIALVESVAEGTEMGLLIGAGPDAVGKYFGNPRVPAVKGQSIAGYDPRAMPGMGVTYATSPMGADHTAGFIGGASGAADMLMGMSKSSQIHAAALDCSGVCMFAQSGGLHTIFEAITALTGKPFGNSEWTELGTNCLSAEIDFNHRAGLTEEFDRLPVFFHEEPLLPTQSELSYNVDDLCGTFASIRASAGGL
ncbi:aldehyde ferredoxin oxidoreductase C-terminal domain-containing protein [Maridesulfovibrio frigidus]|uniref:aldehyde ferredoxin oxidoreductase C-terminal domain-containing protein n=1 Tax=Maridesulfovibrio frigidus TaxID=340956 RepID=UPI0009FE4924|nr:aldehyde ferredoxin oxidoreductase C-terminal domain-containing protein [Maridesulfovibrio frigidus]